MTKYEYPVLSYIFFLFSPIPFQGDIKACRTPALCNVVSRTCIYHQFVSHWFLPEFIQNIIAKTLTSNTHLGKPGFMSSPRQSLNKSESSNYTANGDLAIKPVFVNIVSSAILNSQAGYRCTLVTRLPFPVPRSPFPVPSFSNIRLKLARNFN